MTEVTLKLLGFVRPIPGVHTFVEPIFEGEGGVPMIQQVDDDRIVGFDPVSVGPDEFESVDHKVGATLFGAARFAFELGPRRFLFGNGRSLASTLDLGIVFPDSRSRLSAATLRRVTQFIRERRSVAKLNEERDVTLLTARNEPVSYQIGPLDRSLPLYEQLSVNVCTPRFRNAGIVFGSVDEGRARLILGSRVLHRLSGSLVAGRFGEFDHYLEVEDVTYPYGTSQKQVLWVTHRKPGSRITRELEQVESMRANIRFAAIGAIGKVLARSMHAMHWNCIVLDWSTQDLLPNAQREAAQLYQQLRAGHHGDWGISVPIMIVGDAGATQLYRDIRPHDFDSMIDMFPSAIGKRGFITILRDLLE